MQLTAYDGVLGTRATQPTGNQSGSSGIVPNSYSNGSLTLGAVGQFGLTQGNFANGITAFFVNVLGQWQIGINSGANIPKNANQTLTVNFNFSWTR